MGGIAGEYRRHRFDGVADALLGYEPGRADEYLLAPAAWKAGAVRWNTLVSQAFDVGLDLARVGDAARGLGLRQAVGEIWSTQMLEQPDPGTKQRVS